MCQGKVSLLPRDLTHSGLKNQKFIYLSCHSLAINSSGQHGIFAPHSHSGTQVPSGGCSTIPENTNLSSVRCNLRHYHTDVPVSMRRRKQV